LRTCICRETSRPRPRISCNASRRGRCRCCGAASCVASWPRIWRRRSLTFERAFEIQREAEALLADNEYDVDSFEVLELARDSGCTSYECEFVATAKRLGLKLVTQDAQLRKAFPDLTMPLSGR
jgi:predicted nucleic acid-binding protein